MSTLITVELAQARNAELAREFERAAVVQRAIADRQAIEGTAARVRFPRRSLHLGGTHRLLHV